MGTIIPVPTADAASANIDDAVTAFFGIANNTFAGAPFAAEQVDPGDLMLLVTNPDSVDHTIIVSNDADSQYVPGDADYGQVPQWREEQRFFVAAGGSIAVGPFDARMIRNGINVTPSVNFGVASGGGIPIRDNSAVDDTPIFALGVKTAEVPSDTAPTATVFLLNPRTRGDQNAADQVLTRRHTSDQMVFVGAANDFWSN